MNFNLETFLLANLVIYTFIIVYTVIIAYITYHLLNLIFGHSKESVLIKNDISLSKEQINKLNEKRQIIALIITIMLTITISIIYFTINKGL